MTPGQQLRESAAVAAATITCGRSQKRRQNNGGARLQSPAPERGAAGIGCLAMLGETWGWRRQHQSNDDKHRVLAGYASKSPITLPHGTSEIGRPRRSRNSRSAGIPRQ